MSESILCQFCKNPVEADACERTVCKGCAEKVQKYREEGERDAKRHETVCPYKHKPEDAPEVCPACEWNSGWWAADVNFEKQPVQPIGETEEEP